MKKKILIPALLIGAIAISSAAMAAPGFGKSRNTDCDGQGRQAMTFEQHEERMEMRLERMAIVLDLTDDQQEQIKQLLTKNWQERQEDRAEIQSARDAVRKARHAEIFDETDFRAKIATLNELKTEKIIDRAKQQEELFALLTLEQQEKAEILRSFKDGLGKGQGKSRHGGRGLRS